MSLMSWFRGRKEDPPAKLVVGLGNPGPEYRDTRHNIGFRVVECLAARSQAAWRFDKGLAAETSFVGIAGERVALIAPRTFMNRSGTSVAAALERWTALDPSADLLIIYDDLDLPTGRIRLRPSGGSGGHNGIADILDRLDRQESKDVPRLRFGIGHPGRSGSVVDWVLGPFDASEEATLLPAATERAADAVEAFVAEGIVPAMGRFNESSKPDDS